MILITTEDEDNVCHFLESIRFRHRSTFAVYRGILRDFLLFARVRSGTMVLHEETLRAWLTESRRHRPLHKLVYRARLVDRFLDWMKATGRIPCNPFQELRSQYGQRTAPIARALLSADWAAALEQRRPLLSRFTSTRTKSVLPNRETFAA
jgi:hypothetical protein